MFDVLIFLGVQGSGKGTQVELLKKEFGYHVIEAGNILRSEAASGSELGKKIHEIIHVRGELVPDEITKELIRLEIAKIDSKKIIIDGYPRTVKQLHDLDEILNENDIKEYHVFDIHISDEEAIRRLTKRFVCMIDGEAHKGILDEQVCKEQGGVVTRREDDSEEKIKRRLAWSHEMADPAIELYRKKGVLTQINGEQQIEKVNQDILDVIA